jgi:hypothetical protein
MRPFIKNRDRSSAYDLKSTYDLSSAYDLLQKKSVFGPGHGLQRHDPEETRPGLPDFS